MAAFTVLDHEEFTSGAAVYSKTGFSTSHDHLLWVLSLRTDGGSTDLDYAGLRLGTSGSIDTGTNYSLQMLNGDRVGTPDSSRATGQTAIGNFLVAGTNAEADTFGITKIWVPNYANTTGFKQAITQIVHPDNVTTNYYWNSEMDAVLFSEDTAAIDEVTLYSRVGDFVQYSTFTLYGVTGA